MFVYRACIKTKDGNVIYAKNYGKRAFKIWIDDKKLESSKEKNE